MTLALAAAAAAAACDGLYHYIVNEPSLDVNETNMEDEITTSIEFIYIYRLDNYQCHVNVSECHPVGTMS